MPWRGSVSACLAWGDVFVKHIVLKGAEKAEPSETPWHTYDGTPATARNMDLAGGSHSSVCVLVSACLVP